MDEAWIARQRAETMEAERGVVIDGEWEIRVEGRVFAAFEVATHVLELLPFGSVKICLGMDHGDGAQFSEVAVLAAVDDSQLYDRIWVLDEYVSSGTTTPDFDARAILAMLARNDLQWSQLDHVYGDRAYAGQRGGVSKKSNLDIIRAIGRELGVPYQRLRPEIRTVKRGQGHGTRAWVQHGNRWLHHAQVRQGHFTVRPHCVRLIESLARWDGREASEHKHSIDALRYALDAQITARPRRAVAQVRTG